MTIEGKKLAHDEVEIDNLLHKILLSAKKIELLNNANIEKVRENKVYQQQEDKFRDRMEMIEILVQTIQNLATLADEIDIEDEKLTLKHQEKIQDAIKKIVQASNLEEI